MHSIKLGRDPSPMGAVGSIVGILELKYRLREPVLRLALLMFVCCQVSCGERVSDADGPAAAPRIAKLGLLQADVPKTDPGAEQVRDPREAAINAAIDRLREQAASGVPFDQAALTQLKSLLLALSPDDAASALETMPIWLYSALPSEIESIANKIYAADSTVERRACGQIARVLISVKTTGAADVLIKILARAPDFEYPKDPPATAFAVYNTRGSLGGFAVCCVRNGEPHMMQQYCDMLVKANTSRKRVLIWGLRSSTQCSDFDFLLQLRATETNSVVKTDIDTALCRIAHNLRSEAEPSKDRLRLSDGGPLPLLPEAEAARAQAAKAAAAAALKKVEELDISSAFDRY